MNNERPYQLEYTLSDAAEGHDKTVPCKVSCEGGAIFIQPNGYGDHGTQDGFGTPIVLEVYKGRLRLLVWNDINIEDPTVIDLEDAKETNRKDTED